MPRKRSQISLPTLKYETKILRMAQKKGLLPEILSRPEKKGNILSPSTTSVPQAALCPPRPNWWTSAPPWNLSPPNVKRPSHLSKLEGSFICVLVLCGM
jgi:hypothetical protein